jgi:murein DD-endopeptidase MepM/ murein hydrolase activator NlpD
MTNILSPLTRLNQPVTDISQSSQPGNLSDLSKTFSQILSATLLGGSQSSAAGSGSGDTSSLLLPMMLSLLERLLEQQLSSDNAEEQAATKTESFKAESSKASSSTAEAASAGSDAVVVDGESPSGRPVGGVLTNTFHPGHNGLDFGVPVGTDIKATMSGKVIYAGWNNQGYGNLVIVENGPYRTYFAHLSQVPVQMGEVVSAGSVVGISGNTGNSTGPHLHYEVRRDQSVIDPTSFTL